jgi:nucleotide-binding universal stress UspA family protein
MGTPGVGWRLLVPLDGSELAERALPVAERIAQATHASLILARIVSIAPFLPNPYGYPIPPEIYQQLSDDAQRLATEYIERTATALRQRGLAVETHIARGEPASALLDLASARQVGLIVLTTHGRTGLARFALGSVADRMVRYGHVPVLLVRALATAPQATPLDPALVPLDGSERAEAALPIAVRLAGALIHRITLLRVVAPEANAEERTAAQGYVDSVRQHVEQQIVGRPCEVRALSVVGDPADEIARWAEAETSLVILASRGRSGVQRWLLGSVTDHLLYGTTVPLLVVHSQKAAP